MSDMSAAGGKTFFGHPRGLATLFFTEMWERFSYYGMRAILVLFMVSQIENGGLGYGDATATAIYGLYTGSVYLLALFGGWLADRYIGQRNAVFWGGVIISAGHFSMAVPYQSTFFLGLALIVVGTGLLKPNVSTIVGDLYPEGGSRRDAGFSIFYMGINVGAFTGPLLCGWLGENVNWHYGFSLAGIGMVLGLIQYKMTENYLGDAGVEPKARTDSHGDTGNSKVAYILAAAMIALFIVLHTTGFVDLGTAVGLAKAMTAIIMATVVFYFGYLLLAGGFELEEKKRIVLIFVLFIASAAFWSGFEQAGSSLNLFGKYFTERSMFGWEMPASWLQSINPIFIIILAPIFGAIWVRLGARNLDPSIPAKFAFGLISLGLGFGIMVLAANLAAQQSVSVMWLTLTYLFHTIGELCLSPVGLSTITKLAPQRITGQMMGIWFLATSLGNVIAGQVAGRFDFSTFEKADVALGKIEAAESLDQSLIAEIDEAIIDRVDPGIIQGGNLEAFKEAVQNVLTTSSADSIQQMPNLFLQVTLFTVGLGVILLLFAMPLKKLAKDVK